MQDRPTARELLTTIADLLEQEVLQSVTGPLRHRVRVAVNLCRILERESAQEPSQEKRQLELLRDVLGRASEAGETAAELNGALVDCIKSGSDPELERRAWIALCEVVRGKLAIAKPGYDDYDFAPELE